MDYLDRHLYEVWDFNSVGRVYDETRGYGANLGYSGTFSDKERRTYYQAILDACRNAGIKNVLLHDLFAQLTGFS